MKKKSLLENQSLNDNIKSLSSGSLYSAGGVETDSGPTLANGDVNHDSVVDAAKSSNVKFYPAQLDFKDQ
jgi:hypothetical protein